jgi:hypothetical protein
MLVSQASATVRLWPKIRKVTDGRSNDHARLGGTKHMFDGRIAVRCQAADVTLSALLLQLSYYNCGSASPARLSIDC